MCDFALCCEASPEILSSWTSDLSFHVVALARVLTEAVLVFGMSTGVFSVIWFFRDVC